MGCRALVCIIVGSICFVGCVRRIFICGGRLCRITYIGCGMRCCFYRCCDSGNVIDV